MRNLFQASPAPKPRRQRASRAVLGRSRAVVIALVVSPAGVSLACGGGQGARDGAQSPETASASTSPGSAGNAPGSGAAGAPTTTTATLADAGDTQGTTLTEVSAVASTSASAPSSAKAPHAHDPGRGPADIQAIMSAHRDEARACYDRALSDHPGIEGDLVISWTIDPKGNVTQASLDVARSQIAEPAVVTCVSDIVKRVQFAPSPGGFETKASYPFNFHPRRHAKPAP
jgi:outer membrane biosynthesis protein TonB